MQMFSRNFDEIREYVFNSKFDNYINMFCNKSY